MKFDEMNVEQLEARQAEIASMDVESATTEELEERANELEAIKAELEARAEEAAKAEAERQVVAESRVDAVIKEFKMEEKKMEERFAVNSPEYRDAFLRGLQGKELTAEERAAVTATAAIPTQTMNEIIHKLELNPLIAAVDVTNIPGYVTYPAESVVNDASWLDMEVGSTDSTDAISSITLGAYKLIKTVEITADVDAMSIDAFEAWLVSRLVNKIEKAIDAGILTGTGTTQCTGIVTTKSTADGTFTRAGITWAQLCAIMGKLPGQYHNGAKFVFNPEFFFGKVIGMVDSSKQRVVVLDPQGAVKYNVMGYPAILDGNLSSEEVLFGDLKAYKFNFAKAVEVRKSEEAEFRKGSKVYRAMTLADGKLGDLNAIVRYVATT
jgi:HK97 family phage major capsid protein